jgi:hypothetical protein
MFDANLTLNELQIYMDTTSANDHTALEQESQQQKIIIQTQAQEIVNLKKIVAKFQRQQAAIRRLLDNTSTIVIDHDKEENESDVSVSSENEDVFSESESESSSVLSFEQITSQYFSEPPSKRKAVREGEGYFCEKCDNMAFSTRCSYDRHIRTIHERNFRFPCDGCNAGFETASRLIAHQQRVHSVKQKI